MGSHLHQICLEPLSNAIKSKPDVVKASVTKEVKRFESVDKQRNLSPYYCAIWRDVLYNNTHIHNLWCSYD